MRTNTAFRITAIASSPNGARPRGRDTFATNTSIAPLHAPKLRMAALRTRADPALRTARHFGMPQANLERNKRWCNKRGCKSKHAETCKICRICTKLAGFVRNVRESCANLRNCFCKNYANLRKIYGPVCYGTVCSCLSATSREAGLRSPPRPWVRSRRSCRRRSSGGTRSPGPREASRGNSIGC